MTGRLPSTTGMSFLLPALADAPSLKETVTMVRRFAAEGYATFGVGKVHHSDERPCFDEYGGAMGGLGPPPGQELSYDIGHPPWDRGAYPERDEQMPDHRVADWAAARLAEDHDGPFFLAAGFWRPHVPMFPPRRCFDLHPLEGVVLPEVLAEGRDDLPDDATALTLGLPAPRHDWIVENGEWHRAAQAYLASTSLVDACVENVLDALAASSHAENTIVALLSDHGFHLG